jgi:RNA polymerase sigma-70 factor (ECF subfamily)
MSGASPSPEALIAHVPGLRRYARLRVGDEQRADDLVQDALDVAAPLDDALEATLAARPDAARGAQIRIDLARGPMRLPLAHREVLLLVCVADCAYDEAASILGLPVGTVMSRLSRARAQLRIEMDEPPGAPSRLRRVK